MKKEKRKSNRTINKKRVFFVATIFVLLVVVFTIVFIFINNKRVTVSIKNKIEVSINEEVYNIDNVANLKNGKLLTKKKKIDTSKLGSQKVTIKVKDSFNRTKKYTYTIIVIDKEAPKIEFKDKLITEEGSEIDLLKDVKVIDNSLEDIKVTVDGDYDFNKVGTYELYYVSKDSSGNEKKEKFILEVVEKKVVTPNSPNTGIKRFTTSKGFSGYTEDGITYIDGVLVVNKTYSIPSSYYAGGLTGSTQSAFNSMKSDALALGYSFFVGSGFRSYGDQKYIYNNYVANDGQANADTYSARPGHSEHQTGLAFDVCDNNVSACITSDFDNTEQAKWINDNCYKYGLIIRYPKGKTNETGYMYESWHLRYVGVDLATKLYNNGDWITLENYFGITSQYNY